MTAIVGVIGVCLGFVLGFIACAFLSAGKAEDAYAEGYDQAVQDSKKK